jgi:hypothetical protein
LENNVAIYWDFENVHANVLDEMRGTGSYNSCWWKTQEPVVELEPILEYASGFGSVIINRAYSNWQRLARYRDDLQRWSFELVQIFPLNSSKNGADIRLAIDVVDDIAAEPSIGTIVVVSADSDFVSLAQRCKRVGRTFVGVGAGNINDRYQFACSEFRRYSAVLAEAESLSSPIADSAADSSEPLAEARELLVRSIRHLARQRDGNWALKANVQPQLKRLAPSFDHVTLGFRTFGQFLSSMDDLIEERPGEKDHELAVRADLTATSAINEGVDAPLSAGLVSISSAELLVRQLERRSIRLPAADRLWIMAKAIEVLADEDAERRYEGFEGLFMAMANISPAITNAWHSDFVKMKACLLRHGAFDLLGDEGIRVRAQSMRECRRFFMRYIIRQLAEPSADDLDVIEEAFGGSEPDEDMHAMWEQVLSDFLSGREDSESGVSD